MSRFTITKKWLNDNKTENGGWTKLQVEMLNLDWPLKKNWQKEVIGQSMFLPAKQLFEKYKEPNKKQFKKVMSIDNCIAYLFKNVDKIDPEQMIRIKSLFFKLK